MPLFVNDYGVVCDVPTATGRLLGLKPYEKPENTDAVSVPARRATARKPRGAKSGK